MHSLILLFPLLFVPPVAELTIREEVSVTADRFLQEENAGRVQKLTEKDLKSSASVTVDDALRRLSGFQLFRRSGSRTANPTSQGASLRGVGSSGASRLLVLYDGVPINDPFGGWLYWGAIPRRSLKMVEAYRGGGSDLYGTNALAGIINLISEDNKQSNVELEAAGGNQKTSIFNLNTNQTWLDTSFRLAVENFYSDGYVLLAPEDRGSVDRPAGSKHTLLQLAAERDLNSDANYFIRGSYYDEDRDNGTVLQTNATILRQVSSGIQWNHTELGNFRSTVFGRSQQFDQQFSIVSDSRDSEELASSQQVKTKQLGFTSDWLSMPIGLQTFQAGIDAQTIHGEMREWMLDPSDPGANISGRQFLLGLFVHDRIVMNEQLEFTFGSRFDSWRNSESASVERNETAWSPRVSLRFSPHTSTAFNFAWYRAFRAPTLNELYRPFRLGSTLTLANPALDAERLTGTDASISHTISQGVAIRSSFFLMDVEGAIANRTILFSPGQIVRQRENLGRIRSKGIELELLSQLNGTTDIALRYQYANSKIVESIVSQLQDLRTPQVPYHQASLICERRWNRHFVSNVEARYSSSQFDDDLNRFLLKSYIIADVTLRYNVARSWEIFAAAENLFDQQYELAKIPFPTYGPPRFVYFGIRFQSNPN
jgi:outer membrane receptor protein involved in Fe transport